MYGLGNHLVEMYCHNPECDDFNQPQEMLVIGATRWDPSYLDKDYCPGCGEDIHDDALDIDQLASDSIYALDETTEHGRDLIKALLQHLDVDTSIRKENAAIPDRTWAINEPAPAWYRTNRVEMDETAHYASELPF